MPQPTVSVTAGSTVVVGTGTSFIERAGDLFVLAGLTAVIAYSAPGQITLAQPWPGATLSGRADFATQRSGPYWSSTVTTNTAITELIQKLDAAAPARFDAAGPLAQRDTLNNQPPGFVFLAVDPLPWRLYAKVRNTNQASDWSPGQEVSSPPASTVEAQEAATNATEQAGIATGGASTATTQAGISTQAAGTATTQAGVATTQAGISTTQAGVASQAAGTSTAQAGISTTQAGIATAAAGTATTQAGIATAQSQLAVQAQAATAGDRIQTGSDRGASSASASTAQTARDDARSAAADAAYAAAALSTAAFDFNYETAAAPTDDWNT